MQASELEQILVKMLDVLSIDPKLEPASRAAGMGGKFIHIAIARSKANDQRYSVRWHSDNFRQFAELVPLAQRTGRVKRMEELRGVTINGEVQYVLDPGLLVKFGFPDDSDAKDMAELAGYPHYPHAVDSDGNKIPLLSARHPRPQRQHRPHPHGRTVPLPTLPPYESEWKPELPPYHRSLRTAAAPPQVFLPTPATPHVSPLKAELLQRLAILKERGPTHPRAVDNHGRLAMPQMIRGQRADDPPEHGA